VAPRRPPGPKRGTAQRERRLFSRAARRVPARPHSDAGSLPWIRGGRHLVVYRARGGPGAHRRPAAAPAAGGAAHSPHVGGDPAARGVPGHRRRARSAPLARARCRSRSPASACRVLGALAIGAFARGGRPERALLVIPLLVLAALHVGSRASSRADARDAELRGARSLLAAVAGVRELVSRAARRRARPRLCTPAGSGSPPPPCSTRARGACPTSPSRCWGA
jgi:hypothetical protein